jgi:hypothetical protein
MVDEKAYETALERIPESRQKYGPWRSARSSESAAKNKTSKTALRDAVTEHIIVADEDSTRTITMRRPERRTR